MPVSPSLSAGRGVRSAWMFPCQYLSRAAAIETLLVCFKVLQPDTTSGAQALLCLFDAAQKTRVVFEPIFEPVLLRLESNRHACRFSVTRDDDLLRLSLTKIAR